MFAILSRLVAAALVVLAVAAPASAKEKPKPADFVTTSASGTGIAPGAPDAVREKVKKFLEARGQGFEAEGPGPAIGTQRIARTSWIGCTTHWARRSLNHFFGYNLWHYYQQVSWCSNGFSIYSWSRERWPDVNFPGWAFDGHIDSSLGGTSYRKEAWTQGSFRYCIGYCTYYYPWVYQEVTAGGGHYYNTGL